MTKLRSDRRGSVLCCIVAGLAALVFSPATAHAQRVAIGKTGGNGKEGNQGVTRRVIELRVPCKQGCRFKFSVTPALGSDTPDLHLEKAEPDWAVVAPADADADQKDQVTIAAGAQIGDPSGVLTALLTVGVIGDTDVEPDETIEIKVEDMNQAPGPDGYPSYTLKAGRIVNDDGAGTGAGAPVSRVDFNRDGRPDVLWLNTATREAQIWYMNGAVRTGRQTVGEAGGATLAPSAPWKIVGTGDFNLDGATDILWHNDATHETQIWYLSGTTRTGRATVELPTGGQAQADAPWAIGSTGDFNHDGQLDILWHNDATRETAIWYMKGATRIGRATVTMADGGAALADRPWRIAATGDFNQDGQTDILWQNAATRETAIWYMNGASRTGRATVVAASGEAAMADAPWTIAGVGDFNQDGNVDILWHNDATRETAIWYLTGATRTGRDNVTVTDGGSPLAGPPWTIVNH